MFKRLKRIQQKRTAVSQQCLWDSKRMHYGLPFNNHVFTPRAHLVRAPPTYQETSITANRRAHFNLHVICQGGSLRCGEQGTRRLWLFRSLSLFITHPWSHLLLEMEWCLKSNKIKILKQTNVMNGQKRKLKWKDFPSYAALCTQNGKQGAVFVCLLVFYFYNHELD